MPDWSYRTVLQPVLFRLPVKWARDFCLGFLGSLARLPGGGRVIDFLGHMGPDPRLQRQILGLEFRGPVGLGCAIDPSGTAAHAFDRFGFGWIEIGPVSIEPSPIGNSTTRGADRLSLVTPERAAVSLRQVLQALRDDCPISARQMIRLQVDPDRALDDLVAECRQIAHHLRQHADAFVLDVGRLPDPDSTAKDLSRADYALLIDTIRSVAPGKPLLLAVSCEQDERDLEAWLAANPGPADGLVIDGYQSIADHRHYGPPARELSCRLVARLRQLPGEARLPLVAGGGIYDPADALELLDAGADLVVLDAGLIYSGPGLPKRINEAVLARTIVPSGTAVPSGPEPAPPQQTWFWTLLMGLAMLLGGVLAMIIAMTRVVLPYDEAFVGMTRAELLAVNERLLAFMQHDRVTLAGTMLAVGILYTGLSLSAVRRGLHWARVAILASAFAGFASFFLFLGFGYFDPFHAFVTAVLFQFLLLALHSQSVPPNPIFRVSLREDRAWRLAQWGQLIYVLHGAILIVAGVVISFVGITSVFVPEDLWFMQTTGEAIAGANPRLVPLIAHDRATFGGMLIACGVVVLLATLWGWQRGNRALWWSLLTSGTIAYVATIWVHLAVGYHHFGHLLPAYGGLALLLLGSALSYRHLTDLDRGPVTA